MNPAYLSLTFQMGDFDHEIWQALLGQWPFESFYEEGNTITGYIQDHDITAPLMDFIAENKGKYFSDYELSQVADKNWNEVWESSFNPVMVDDYCLIRAEFHKPLTENFKHVVTIAPKMAFGTGHHATTFMMLQAMSKIDFKNKQVFDFGCGTGILSVVAAKEGAARVIGVDIQVEAIENSNEHALLNGVSDTCQFYLGGIDQVPLDKFDIILANINRNVILENLQGIVDRMKAGGYCLFSGIMFDDEDVLRNALVEKNFEIGEINRKDQWLQVTAVLTGIKN